MAEILNTAVWGYWAALAAVNVLRLINYHFVENLPGFLRGLPDWRFFAPRPVSTDLYMFARAPARPWVQVALQLPCTPVFNPARRWRKLVLASSQEILLKPPGKLADEDNYRVIAALARAELGGRKPTQVGLVAVDPLTGDATPIFRSAFEDL